MINYANRASQDIPTKEKLLSPITAELAQRYNREGKFLNLANVANNANINFNDVLTMRMLFRQIATKCSEVSNFTPQNFSHNKFTINFPLCRNIFDRSPQSDSITPQIFPNGKQILIIP
jgi:hypothetical protein